MPGLRKAEELTIAVLDKIPTPLPGERPVYWDALVPGLGLRVTDKGSKTWIVSYRVRGGSRTARRVTLGPYGKLRGQVTLAMARDKARVIIARAAAGEDPQAEIADRKQSPIFRDFAQEYVARYAKLRKRSWEEDERMITRDLLPAWGDRRIVEITRRDVVELLDAIADRGAPIQANRVLALTRKMFNWAIGRDLLQSNPCAQVPKPGVERRRVRWLDEGEIRAVWRACGDVRYNAGHALRMLLLTGQRSGEVLSMTWQDIGGGWWTIPAAKSKNGLAHRVPLSRPVLELLNELKEAAGKSPWVFPSRMRKGTHLADLHASARQVAAAAGVPFVPHDFRRTVGTWLAKLGVPRLEIAKVLNHRSVDTGDVTAVYDVHQYDEQKRKALDLWSERLMGIVG